MDTEKEESQTISKTIMEVIDIWLERFKKDVEIAKQIRKEMDEDPYGFPEIK